MSGWGKWSSFSSAPKKPPPERGIKMTKAGTTWWGRKWIDALESVLRGDANRLARGRTYARAGRTHDLVIERGKVTAKVTGSRSSPYQISITLRELSSEAWKAAIASMATKAQFAAELLNGEMPRDIDEAFRAGAASLFPTERADLVTGCSCPDWGDPCKHVAATHYVIGEALDRDPFLLFELRGRSKAEVLDALRSARGGAEAGVSKKKRSPKVKARDIEELQAPRVTLTRSDLAAYDRSPSAIPALSFAFDAPVSHGAVIRQLGVPAGWSQGPSPVEALSPIVLRAARTARRMAMGDTSKPDQEEESSSPTATSRANGKRITPVPRENSKKTKR